MFDLVPSNQKEIDVMTLSRLNIPVELVLVAISPDNTKTVLSIKRIDWRFVLTHGAVNVSLELPGNDMNDKSAVGIIQVSFSKVKNVNYYINLNYTQ